MTNSDFTPIAGQTLLETYNRAKEAGLPVNVGPFNASIKRFFKVNGHILEIPEEFRDERSALQMDELKPRVIAESYSATKWFLNEAGEDDLFE